MSFRAVYVFFEDNTTQYVKMTYDGTSWSYKDNANGTAFTNLKLEASGKKLSAVYIPDFVCTDAPTWSTDKWTFGSIAGYYQKTVDEGVSYTVTSTANVNTLNAVIKLTDLTDKGNFVDLGFGDCLWATGNLDRPYPSAPISKTNYQIVSPLRPVIISSGVPKLFIIRPHTMTSGPEKPMKTAFCLRLKMSLIK